MTRNSEFDNARAPESGGFDETDIGLDRYCTRGEMAGDIAHEINNHLAILSGNLELIPLMIKRGQLDKLAQKTEVMRGTIERIAMFCDGLMDQSSDRFNFTDVDMNELIQNFLPFLKAQHRFDGVTIETRLSSEVPFVKADPVSIRQVLIDLLINAADALDRSDGEKLITISTDARTQNTEHHVVIEVSDTGDGVPANLIASLFEKRFTTKPRGRGIGLVACRQIVDHHNGKLRYFFDRGGRFTVELPVNQPECPSALSAPVSESIPVTC